ncbi:MULTISPECIES: AAA family ATPase [Moraxella]|uniref:Chromosome partition protein Smc n=1 Tax=Moraxella lacunata TaxID=477 RepID=A0A1B8PVZ1_MORLA|nr:MULTISPECIES: AAA family ATPase [Moraxella]MBE9578375.1 AAA family ATPase [Moraxella sp. K1664]MBE9587815.1 AAA family ATPase [Moraxella sp. K1630]MBE9591061.1 AAA family ATPase [Moraxella sp. K127]MBE9595954.1 AAA family ATPase [Moraxella sp. K2450]MDH9218695.1 AAA family ATPase [Moraxella lacunata]
MRLKSLKLSGFKSFANPTTFTFKHDVTAIVGPNGCGKSNVIDAIRWVLGETSAKQLRGGAMSDVIFAGVEGRAGKSLASVELTFEHTQDESTGIRHALNLYHELTLRRQVTKEGKSDYYINGQKVRRRDVVDVFLGTGLGARSYAVIEQGMIGRIVDSSPMQLREFIEEAAGVSRYQARRAETEKQLNETKDNLARLNDLQGELKKQHKTLIRQAESAKKYQALNDELFELNKNDLLKRIFEAWQYLETKKQDKDKSAQILHELEQAVNKAKKELDVHSAKLAEANWLKDDARDNYHNARMKEQTAEHNYYSLNQEIASCEDKIARLTELKAQSEASIVENQKSIDEIDKELGQISPDVTERALKLTALQEELTQAQGAFNTAKQQVGELTQKKSDLENTHKLATAQKNRLLMSHERVTKKYQELINKHENKEQNHDKEQDEIKTLTSNIATLNLAIDELSDDDGRQVFDEKSRQVKALQDELSALEKRHASMMGEYDTLHKLVHKPKHAPSAHDDSADNSGADGVVADTKSGVDGIAMSQLDSLKDSIKLTRDGEKHADVLDKFLGFWLDARVMGDGRDFSLLPLINHLSTATHDGKHSHDDKKDKKKDGKKAKHKGDTSGLSAHERLPSMVLYTAPNFRQSSDKLIPLTALIKSPTLALWQGVYLLDVDTQTLDEQGFDELVTAWADELAQGVLILTKTGWIIGSFGVMHVSALGQGGQGQGMLGERAEHAKRLDELEERLGQIESELDDKQRSLKAMMSELDVLRVAQEERHAKHSELTHSLHESKAKLVKLEHQISQDKLIWENFNSQKISLSDELSELDGELRLMDDEIGRSMTALDEHLPILQVAQNTLNVLSVSVDELSGKVRQMTQDRQELTLKQTTLTQNKAHATRLLELSHENVAKADAETKKLIAQSVAMSERLPVLEDAFKQAKAETAELKVQSEEHEAVAKTLVIMQGKLQENLTDAHAKFAAAQASIANAHADVAVGESRLADLGEQMLGMNEQFNLPSTLADFRASTPVFADNSSRIEHIKADIEKLGAVNLAAAAELAELEERVSPLDEQVADITDSMKKLQDAIRAIDDKTKQLFLGMLKAVNDEMNALFAKVFGGGQASLTLIDDESLPKADKWRAGLVLMAQPKGKKNSRLAVLSGGEKTLTALSLIFAIFKQHPAPFCVLDEVDAPLDDANVGRFTSLIHELSDSVQFIFISHNKLAMQAAHELKGITMPTAGISSLVTVNLEEAEKYLEPRE